MRIVILSGGSGTRLWPLSNAVQSKQFLRVLDGPNGKKESMLQRIYRQLEVSGIQKGKISIITGREQADYIRRQIGSETVLIEEPERRNTFPAISLAALHLAQCQNVPYDEPIIVMPADVYTEPSYFDIFKEMERLCKADVAELILMGIKPERASDQFGYIVPEQPKEMTDTSELEMPKDTPRKEVPAPHRAFKVDHFEEKPSVRRAEELIEKGALWNGGVFAFKLGWLLKQIQRIAPALNYESLHANYSMLEKTSFDYAVVEKTPDIAVIPYAGLWMDLGTWNTICSKMANSVTGNVISAQASDGSTIINELPVPMAVVGIPNAVICATWDGILVADKKESVHLKELLNIPETRPMYEQRRWGEYSVLQNMETDDGRKTLTKHLAIADGNRISYQKHQYRDEIWTLLSGSGEVTLDDDTFQVQTGDTVKIPAGMVHSIRGLHNLHILEIQIGSELLEEDIQRLEYSD